MKIVQINHFSYKATGNIMMNIHKELLKNGIDSYVAWGRGRKAQNDHEYYMNDEIGVRVHGVYTRLTDRTGFASSRATRKLIDWIDEISPDIIHLHCIHGYYINIGMLFDHIKKKKIKVVWTQHDCWAFTGHCAHFDVCGCSKWKDGCFDCEQLHTYPAAYRDSSKRNWNDKKTLFQGADIEIVTPSNWLKDLVKQSFLKEYPVHVINNGVDTDTFFPCPGKFRAKYQLQDKFIILGVAIKWTERKGLKDLIELRGILDDTYAVVVVGVTEKQKKQCPDGIIAINRTNNAAELAEIYSDADVFFNPTYEEVFGMVNAESIACGTAVITYNSGGAPEGVSEQNGWVVNKHDLDSVVKILQSKKKQCTLPEKFTINGMVRSYFALYNDIIKRLLA